MKTKAIPALFSILVVVLALAAIMATPASGQEDYLTLAKLAEQIQSGEIDVGEEYGMGEEQRFHVIHADVIDMSCKQCHVREAPYEIGESYSDEADPVDRRVCLGCHLTGPATRLYKPQE